MINHFKAAAVLVALLVVLTGWLYAIINWPQFVGVTLLAIFGGVLYYGLYTSFRDEHK